MKRERGTGRLFLRGNIWWCQYYFHGEAVRVSCETSDERRAAKFLRGKIAEVLSGTHQDSRNLTYENIRAAYLLDFQTNKRKSLHKDKKGNLYLDCVKRLDDFFSGYRVAEIDADLIRKFHADQQAKRLSNASINRSVSSLRRMFNLALQDGKLRTIPFFPMLKESAPRSGFFERDQYDKLAVALPQHLRALLALGYFCGLRLSEARNLTWDQIDFIGNTVTLRAGETKNDQARTIPIVPQLRAILVAQYQARQENCPYVCYRVDRRGHAVKIEGFRRAWQSRCIKLGFGSMVPKIDPVTGQPMYEPARKDRQNSKPKPKTVYTGLRYHDLRRSFVRALVRSGTSEKVAMKFSGHLSRAVFDRYDISTQKDVHEAGERLAAYLQKNGDKTGTDVHQDAAVVLPIS